LLLPGIFDGIGQPLLSIRRYIHLLYFTLTEYPITHSLRFFDDHPYEEINRVPWCAMAE
jgi:hypothetical protein